MGDVNDAERVGIPEAHFSHYFNRYFKKSLNPKVYKKDDLAQLCDYVKDTVAIQDGLLVRKLAADASSEMGDFVKMQEESRRERQRRLDAGDESVRIKFDGLEKQIEAERKRVLQAAADEERRKKQVEDHKKQREEAAAKAKVDAEKKAAQDKNKPAPQAAKPAQKATWNSNAGKEAPKATWNSGATKQAAWSSDKQSSWSGDKQGSWGSQSTWKTQESKGKGGGKGRW